MADRLQTREQLLRELEATLAQALAEKEAAIQSALDAEKRAEGERAFIRSINDARRGRG
jgi:hypothetical protein